jgi:hypothetical protein
MNAKAYPRSTSALRREAYAAAYCAAALLFLYRPASVWAQPTPLPVLTYQATQAYPQQYVVTNSSGQQRQAFQYSVPSGSPVWTSEDSVVWRNVEAHENANPPNCSGSSCNYPIAGWVPPNAPIINQRVGYDFYLDETQIPNTDLSSPPRNEFDSTPDHPVNIGNQCDPTPYTWEKDGVVKESTAEKIYIWSEWLPQDPALDQSTGTRYWADLNQWHPGGPWNGTPQCSDCCNWYLRTCGTVDCNTWPVLATNDYARHANILFHTNRLSTNCSGACGDTEPPRMLDVPLTQVYGHWVDYAMYIKPSQDDNVGLVRFWVNGNEIIPAFNRRSFYYPNPTPPDGHMGPYPPFYYVKQGYYRDRRIRDQAQGGVHVYMTPMLVTTPSALAPIR